MSTFEPPETTAAITAESRKLLELFGRAIRQATPERTQEWERRIERVLDDGRALIDAAELGERVTERKCSCTRTDRVALELGDEPLPGKVVPIRKVAVVRKPPTVRDLFREAIAALKPAKPCPRTSADEFAAAHGIETDEDGGAA